MPEFITAVPQPSFGVNYTDDLFAIGRNQVYKAVNCHLTENGVLKTRKGSRLLNTTALDGVITSIYDYRRPDGSSSVRYILVTAGTNIYQYDEHDEAFYLKKTLLSADRPTWASFYDGNGNSVALMCNGTDFLKFDGFNWEDITFVTGINNPRYIITYDDMLLASGCDSDPYKVFCSAALDATDWEWGDTPAAQYWTMKSSGGDRITGLGSVYDFGLIFQRRGVTMITGADVTDTSTEQIEVAQNCGATSHWSIQSVGNVMFFADESHVYRGILREAVTNGLVVTTIDHPIAKYYSKVTGSEDIVSVYDSAHEEILWGVKTKQWVVKDTSLVYSTHHSGNKGELGYVDVWSGWHENGTYYEPHTLAAVLDSNEKPQIWRGDSYGFVYVMEDSYQHKDTDKTGTDKDIETLIISGAIAPGAMSQEKKLKYVTPIISQCSDESTDIQWMVDGIQLLPSTALTLSYRNLVPVYRSDTNTDQSAKWDNFVYNDAPYIVRPFNTDMTFHYIQLYITNPGTNDVDSISYSGVEIKYSSEDTSRIQG